MGKKYEAGGEATLEDRRGKAEGPRKGKPKKAVSLEEEDLRLKAENELLKKLFLLEKA